MGLLATYGLEAQMYCKCEIPTGLQRLSDREMVSSKIIFIFITCENDKFWVYQFK